MTLPKWLRFQHISRCNLARIATQNFNGPVSRIGARHSY